MEFLLYNCGKAKIVLHSISSKLFPTFVVPEIPSEPPYFFGIPELYLTVLNISVVAALTILIVVALVYHWILFKRRVKAKKVQQFYFKLCDLLKREQANFEEMRLRGRTPGDNMPNKLLDLARRVLIISKKLDALQKMLDELDEVPKIVHYFFFKIF